VSRAWRPTPRRDDVPERFSQLLKIHWLRQVAVEAGGSKSLGISCVARDRDPCSHQRGQGPRANSLHTIP